MCAVAAAARLHTADAIGARCGWTDDRAAGHFSKFIEPDSVAVTAEVFGARRRTGGRRGDTVSVAAVSTPMPDDLVAVAAISTHVNATTVTVVVLNVADDGRDFLLVDASLGLAAHARIPAHAIQTYQYVL